MLDVACSARLNLKFICTTSRIKKRNSVKIRLSYWPIKRRHFCRKLVPGKRSFDRTVTSRVNLLSKQNERLSGRKTLIRIIYCCPAFHFFLSSIRLKVAFIDFQHFPTPYAFDGSIYHYRDGSRKFKKRGPKTHLTFLEILISKSDFGPAVKLPGLSRNGPQKFIY